MHYRMTALMLALVAMSGCDKSTPSSPAPAAPAAAASPNAAPMYRDAFARIGKDANLLIGSVMFKREGATFDSMAGGSLDQAYAAMKARQDAVESIIKASQMTECSFNLPRATGDEVGTGVVELCGSLRSAARLLNADAARLWTAGDTDGAVARVEAIYGLSAHATEEQIVLVALTVAAVEMLGNEATRTMAAGAAGRALSAGQKERLLKAIGRLHGADPSGVVRARQAESVTDPNVLKATKDVEARVKQDFASVKAALRGE